MELLARVKAVLRRSEAYLLNGVAQERLTVGGITLDPLTLTALFADGRSVALTPTEFRLLHCLMRNAGQTLTHDTLLESVWGYDYEGDSNPLPVYIRRLRAKIEERPDQPQRLVTVRGLGYRFEADCPPVDRLGEDSAAYPFPMACRQIFNETEGPRAGTRVHPRAGLTKSREGRGQWLV